MPHRRRPRPNTPYTGPRPGLDDPRYKASRERLKLTGTHVCHICKHSIDMQVPYPHPLSWTYDHKVPRSHLHPDDDRHWHPSNGAEAHQRCNQARGNKPVPFHGRDVGLTTSIDW